MNRGSFLGAAWITIVFKEEFRCQLELVFPVHETYDKESLAHRSEK
jgi:hypothetical protein